jgi:3-deoxy-7-phosphoheptulonate synthase
MIVTLKSERDLDAVRRALTGLGLWVERVARASDGSAHVVVGQGSTEVDPELVARVPGVASVAHTASAHPKVDAHGPAFHTGEASFERGRPAIISGPCSVESEAQIERIAAKLAKQGVAYLRGGAFKPRTSPYAFQGVGNDALVWLRRAADQHGMRVVTEVMSENDVSIVAEYADVLQIGSRNMSNYALLKVVGRTGKPVMLKRSMSATVDEWLLAGEYLLSHGTSSVAFCERGIRGFDPSTRNLLDLAAVALLAHVYGLPVVVDPSHATGRRDLVMPLAHAALAAGAAAVMIETHDDPACAQSDGAQALAPEAIAEIAAVVARGAVS